MDSNIIEGLLGKGNRSEGIDRKLDKAEEEKQQGNEYFKKGDLPNALYHYHSAMMYVKGLVGLTSEETKKMNTIKLAVNNNMAAVYLKDERYIRCVECCNTVLQIEENNEKALFRRGKAFLAQNNLDKAKRDLEQAGELNPGDKMIQRELLLLQQKMKKQDQLQKKFYSNMFQKMSQESEEQSTDNKESQESKETEVKEK